MRPIDARTLLSRCLLAGFLTGLVAAVVIAIFSAIYRHVTHLITYMIVGPVNIFVGFVLFNLGTGIIYFYFTAHLKNGLLFYRAMVLSIMLMVLFTTAFNTYPPDENARKFRGLILGMEILDGSLAILLIPWFANRRGSLPTNRGVRKN